MREVTPVKQRVTVSFSIPSSITCASRTVPSVFGDHEFHREAAREIGVAAQLPLEAEPKVARVVAHHVADGAR